MRATSIFDGLTIVTLVTVGLISTGNAEHGLFHGNALRQIMHKPMPSSGGSSDVTILVPTATAREIFPNTLPTALGMPCLDSDCGPSNESSQSDVSVHGNGIAKPQVHVHSPERDNTPAIPTRRSRSRSTPMATGNVLESAKAGVSSIFAALSGPHAIFDHSHDDLKRADRVHAPRAAHHNEARHDVLNQTVVLGPFPQPTSSSPPLAANASSICPDSNGTTYISVANIYYQIVCGIDFPDNDYPFQLVTSFESCVQKCDAYNYDHHHVRCLAALFVPNREGDANDCYLKSSTSSPTASTIGIQGAVRLSGVKIPTASSSCTSKATSPSSRQNAATHSSATVHLASSSISSSISSSSAVVAGSQHSSATAALPTSGSSPGVTYASGKNIIVPAIARSHLQGSVQNIPTQQYVDYSAPVEAPLTKSLLKVGVNSDLSTEYDLSLQTGALEVNISTQSMLSPMVQKPHLSRDGGRGGSVNGQHLFVFSDTGSYTPPTLSTDGKFLGFVSSSVAIDTGMNGLSGNALYLQDGIGEWSDADGRMRGFAPLTEGENAYNQKMQGQGQRYAIWPESSIIPLDATTGLIYAPIVYDNVNMATKAAVFTYTGATLLTITAGGKGGPIAERTVPKIFEQDQVEWGCAGGIRSWGPSGIGGSDGSVYILGNTGGGILLGRTSPTNVGDVNSYKYWNGKAWTSNMLPPSSTAYFITGAMMDIDIFYSPRHLTFIIVYLSIYADSTFYYRYLEADQGILPPFAPGADKHSDYVENILKYSWSEQKVLYKASPGLSGKYVYSGGVHQGYYGANDIINGGSKMLISWTAPTGRDPSSWDSEYQIITAEIDWA